MTTWRHPVSLVQHSDDVMMMSSTSNLSKVNKSDTFKIAKDNNSASPKAPANRHGDDDSAYVDDCDDICVMPTSHVQAPVNVMRTANEGKAHRLGDKLLTHAVPKTSAAQGQAKNSATAAQHQTTRQLPASKGTARVHRKVSGTNSTRRGKQTQESSYNC